MTTTPPTEKEQMIQEIKDELMWSVNEDETLLEMDESESLIWAIRKAIDLAYEAGKRAK